MKRIILLFSLVLSTFLHGQESLMNTYSFTRMEEALPPHIVSILNETGYSSSDHAIIKGVLFSYKSRKSASVAIAGNFSNWTPRQMKRGENGVWFYFLPEKDEGGQIEYKFLVDGIWCFDPNNSKRNGDGNGSYVSLAPTAVSSEDKHLTYKLTEEEGIPFVVFRTWQPDAGYVSVAGDFNNWNPENDPLTRNRNGVWETKINIPPGVYRYKLIIDGRWTVDLYNPRSASDGVDGICSVLEVDER